MKHTSMMVCAALLAAGAAQGQQALKTDPAGNPLTPLNLGGGNVTGVLGAGHLPPGAGAPRVQAVADRHGSVTVASGVDVVLLTAALDGPLTLILPGAGSGPAGRALAVVDPAGYSAPGRGVGTAPAAGDTLDGAGAAQAAVLAGPGAAVFYADGAAGWTSGGGERTARKGQPGGYAGLDGQGGVSAPYGVLGNVVVQPFRVGTQFGGITVADAHGTALVLDGGAADVSAGRFNVSGQLDIGGQLALDAGGLFFGGALAVDQDGSLYAGGARWFDGQGNVTLGGPGGAAGALRQPGHSDQPAVSARGELLSRGTVTLLPVDPATVATPAAGAVAHYVNCNDGKEYVRDGEGHDHALW